MATISGKFHQNLLKTVGGVAETRTSVDKLTDKPKTIVPFELCRGTKKQSCGDKIVSTDGQ